jgi:hypothetical protein
MWFDNQELLEWSIIINRFESEAMKRESQTIEKYEIQL